MYWVARQSFIIRRFILYSIYHHFFLGLFVRKSLVELQIVLLLEHKIPLNMDSLVLQLCSNLATIFKQTTSLFLKCQDIRCQADRTRPKSLTRPDGFFFFFFCKPPFVLMSWHLCSHCPSGNKPRESCGKTCQGDRDDEWMGVSLARQNRADGKVLVSWLMRTGPDYSNISVKKKKSETTSWYSLSLRQQLPLLHTLGGF